MREFRSLNPLFRTSWEFSRDLIEAIDLERYPVFGSFLRQNISLYSVDVYADSNPRPEDKAFHTTISESQAKLIFCEEIDFKGNCLHVLGHQFLSELWREVRVKKSVFQEHELDFIEDIFIQAFVSQIAPSLFEVYPRQFLRFRPGKDCLEAASLLKQDTLTSFQEVRFIHQWLYETNDRLNKNVFEKYCFLISHIKANGQFQGYLK
jgi:hypothetical protein